MRIAQINKNKPEKVFIAVRNNETTNNLVKGNVVAFAISGTEDGLQVYRNDTPAAPLGSSLVAGVMVESSVGPADIGLCQVYGFCLNTQLVLQTRVASTDAWPGYVAGNIGDVLIPNTDSLAGCDNYGSTAAQPAPLCIVLCQTYDSASSVASDSNDANLASTTLVKTFLRML